MSMLADKTDMMRTEKGRYQWHKLLHCAHGDISSIISGDEDFSFEIQYENCNESSALVTRKWWLILITVSYQQMPYWIKDKDAVVW